MTSETLYQHIEAGDLDGVVRELDRAPALLQARHPDDERWDEISPLHAAAKHGHLELVKLLVDQGAEVYSNPMCTYPPVMIAAWRKHSDIVDYFVKEIPDRAEGTNGLGVTINLAAREGWADVVARHIEADPLSVYQRGWIGDSPLHWPAHNGHVDIVEMLLDAGAEIEADEINCYGGKPLHWASEHEPASVKLLLERGANVNSRNMKADTEFHGVTPLIMNATQKDDCAEVTELLLAAGADMDAQDHSGKTAIDYAEERGHERVLAVLRSDGA